MLFLTLEDSHRPLVLNGELPSKGLMGGYTHDMHSLAMGGVLPRGPRGASGSHGSMIPFVRYVHTCSQRSSRSKRSLQITADGPTLLNKPDRSTRNLVRLSRADKHGVDTHGDAKKKKAIPPIIGASSARLHTNYPIPYPGTQQSESGFLHFIKNTLANPTAQHTQSMMELYSLHISGSPPTAGAPSLLSISPPFVEGGPQV